MKRPTKKKLTVLVVLVVAAVGGYVAWSMLAAPDETPRGEIYVVGRGDLVEVASASGTIEPKVQVEVKSRTSGEVIEILVEEGQQVEAGQLLFRLDPADAERAVREARNAQRRVTAELTQSRASLVVAEAQERDARTARDVSARGTDLGLVASEATRSASSAAEVAAANVKLRRAQLSASQTQVSSAQLSVEEAERRLSETEIHAPCAGTILSVEVERGSIVASAVTNVGGGTPLATLADLTDLRVVGAIDESQVGRVQPGQSVAIRVDAYPRQTFGGEVLRVSPLGQETSNVVTFDVEIRVKDEHSDLLRSGMSADVEIQTGGESNVLLVPLTAIESEGPRHFVRLASGERRPIRTGANDGARIAVVEGLADGERILIGGAPIAARPEQAKSILPMGRPRGGSRAGGGGGGGGPPR